MSEAFLHYIWKHQYFDKTNLQTTDGESVDVFKTGYHNTDAGPDFKEASVKIRDINWRGQVEIHHRSSDWYAHGHENDVAYDNTVLHVVWKDDKEVLRANNSKIPTIELCHRIDVQFHTRYDRLLKNGEPIPCSAQIDEINSITRLSMVDRAVFERLQRKSIDVLKTLESNNNDWEETAYQLLARNFGFKINAEPFFDLAKSIPYKILKRHSDNPLQVEALLFGQAGFLGENSSDHHVITLKKEYDFLKQKYKLQQRLIESQWKFLRLRPPNFPTLRIAQFAAFISASSSLFSSFIEEDSKSIIKKLRSNVSSYWKRHYRFGHQTKKNINGLGLGSARLICINTVAPLLTAYSKKIDEQRYLDRAITLLQALSAEKNRIVDQMKALDFEIESAFDSQGLIELHNNYCRKKKCLECVIGTKIIKP